MYNGSLSINQRVATISVVVITKNEENNIRDCLDSARWADQIIVVDSESTDRTIEIAKEYTEKIFVLPFSGFGPQKNFGIDQSTSHWILILDADERISQELKREIKELIGKPRTPCIRTGLSVVRGKWSQEEPIAYRIPRHNFYYGVWVRWGGIYPDYQIRLFRKGRAYYNDTAIHENLIFNGEIGTLSGHIDHYTEKTIEDHFKKFNLYTSLAALELQKTRKEVHWYNLFFNPLVVFLKKYFLKQGFRDGIHGLIIGVFASMYNFVKYAKLWEFLSQPKKEG